MIRNHRKINLLDQVSSESPDLGVRGAIVPGLPASSSSSGLTKQEDYIEITEDMNREIFTIKPNMELKPGTTLAKSTRSIILPPSDGTQLAFELISKNTRILIQTAMDLETTRRRILIQATK